jgi:acyl carrier protein
MTASSRTDILDNLERTLRNFHGREYSGPIGPDTYFFADLGLASIDAVVLGETLERHYGRRLPFADLMANLGRRVERDITLGELAAFVESSLAQKD